MPAKTILHLNNQFALANGLSRTIQLVTSELDGKYRFLLYADDVESAAWCFGQKNLLSFAFINRKWRNILSPLLLFYLLRIVVIYKVQIIHSHHRYYDLLAGLISLITGAKFVTSVQVQVDDNAFLSFKSRNIITCSNAIKNHLVNHYKVNPLNVTVIYNFIHPIVVEKLSTRGIDSILHQKRFSFAFFGRFDNPEKSIDVILKAITKLENQSISILFLGKGAEEESIKKFSESSQIEIAVLNSQSNVFDYYPIVDCVLLPSRIDPFPLVMLEAGYFGKPFIGGNTGGIAELIEHGKTGLLVEPGDAEDLANAMLYVLEHREEAELMGKEFQKVIKSRFLAEHIIPQYESYYNNLLNN